jgi:hypothetical protein
LLKNQLDFSDNMFEYLRYSHDKKTKIDLWLKIICINVPCSVGSLVGIHTDEQGPKAMARQQLGIKDSIFRKYLIFYMLFKLKFILRQSLIHTSY